MVAQASASTLRARAERPIFLVLTENTHSVAASVRHLAGRGHRAIAFMRGLDGHPSFAERRAGYRTAIAELGLEPIELHCDHPDFHVRGWEVIGEWLDSHAGQLGFTALVVCNDDAAAGALNGLRARGLQVPEDVSVVGFDDNDIAAILWPPLTTSHVHRELLGALGVRRLLERAAEPDAPSLALTIDTAFVERQSVRSI
jgi:DNA-binding LacI/PurR family transcriptional regulator